MTPGLHWQVTGSEQDLPLGCRCAAWAGHIGKEALVRGHQNHNGGTVCHWVREHHSSESLDSFYSMRAR